MKTTSESVVSSTESDKVKERPAGKSPVKFMMLWFGLPLILVLVSEVFGLSRVVDGWVGKLGLEPAASTHHVTKRAHPSHVDPVPAVGKPTVTETPAPGVAPVAPK